MQDGLRNPHPLQHAFGKLAQLHSAHVRQAHPLQHFVDSRRALFGIDAGKLAVVVEQFAGSKIVVKVGLLRQEADLRLHPRIVDFHAQNSGRAGGGEYEPHQQLERGGLARAVGPQKAEDLAFLDGEIERAQGVLGPLAPEADAVGFFQTENFDGSHG